MNQAFAVLHTGGQSFILLCYCLAVLCTTRHARVPAQVTFLYNLSKGACPKSYGVNVARLAGLPDAVVQRASSFARQLEEQHQSQQHTQRTEVLPEEWQKLQSICRAIKDDSVNADLQE